MLSVFGCQVANKDRGKTPANWGSGGDLTAGKPSVVKYQCFENPSLVGLERSYYLFKVSYKHDLSSVNKAELYAIKNDFETCQNQAKKDFHRKSTDLPSADLATLVQPICIVDGANPDAYLLVDGKLTEQKQLVAFDFKSFHETFDDCYRKGNNLIEEK